ncbi:hypothetical protein FNV43_RR12527 [Rhamnella rubrinervis]|uniref:SHSP domain-containing protein n=1 Tax=Rhamnella rubrinervis TaxID=2594499 RepID=A0A8K0H7T2_9ROSA|nr:hypothetical protein FNV43_RR12527 [Rhamnella rubrinervis]
MASLGPWYGGSRGGFNDSSGFGWDMFDPFMSLYHGGSSPGQGHRREETTAIASVNVDWRESDTAHVFRADLPGVKKEHLKVQVEDGNILEISGERSKEQEEKTDRWFRVERQHGSFVRRFRLHENAELVGIRCGLEHGVLNITVPKEEMAPKNVRNIDVAERMDGDPKDVSKDIEMDEWV